MIWLGFIGSSLIVAAAFAQGFYFGHKTAKSEGEHHDLHIENGYLKLLGARMGQIRAAHKGIARLRRKLDRTRLKLRRAIRPLEEREPPHCPTCACGIPVPQHWSEYVKLRDDLYALRSEILEARKVGRPPEAFWLTEHPTTGPVEKA